MAALVGHVERHDYEVTEADRDVFEAARAEVLLARLKGMDEGDFEILVVVIRAHPKKAQNNSRRTTMTAAATNA